MTDASGNTVSTIELDPFGGNTNRNCNDAFQPPRFTTYERDRNPSDEAMHRRYNCWRSRFDQPDPYDGSYDLTNRQSTHLDTQGSRPLDSDYREPAQRTDAVPHFHRAAVGGGAADAGGGKVVGRAELFAWGDDFRGGRTDRLFRREDCAQVEAGIKTWQIARSDCRQAFDFGSLDFAR